MNRNSPPHNQEPPNLSEYAADFVRGRPAIVEALWILTQWIFVSSWLPGSAHRRVFLRMFGASIGDGAVIKPRIRVKFPWRLKVGSHAWIGEGVWIDNLANVEVENDAVLSQGVYLCTGSHDWTSTGFDLLTKPIVVKAGAWVAARSTIGPGVTVKEGAVLGLGSTTSKDLDAWTVYAGSPAKLVKLRSISTSTEDSEHR